MNTLLDIIAWGFFCATLLTPFISYMVLSRYNLNVSVKFAARLLLTLVLSSIFIAIGVLIVFRNGGIE